MKLFLSLLIFLLLTSCTTFTPPENQSLTWEERAARVSHLETWAVAGKIGIRTEQESLSANLTWSQHQQNYVISLFGPLGVNSFELAGNSDQVKLTLSDGKQFIARNPETLLREQTGWRIPVSNLYYWIRGLPVPGLPSRNYFDEYHHIVELKQQNWHVEYLRYAAIDGIDLPTKMTLTYPGINVKIIISQWKN